MNKIIMTKGLPASGKSTWAKEYLSKRRDVVRVNKDELRAMLHNSKWSKQNEAFVLDVRNYIVEKALRNKLDVIVDDTNLHSKHKNEMWRIASEFDAKVEIEDFTSVSVEECIKRDAKRVNGVGKEVIMKMYNQFLKPEVELSNKVEFDEALSNCYIFDIDGTLAIKGDRSPYDWSKVSLDTPNKPVIQTLKMLKSTGVKIFIFSGRKDTCRHDTAMWLFKHAEIVEDLIMRDALDDRKDSIVKEEFYNTYIRGKYNVLGIFDDRNQVVEMWRSLGLPVYQVAEGDF